MKRLRRIWADFNHRLEDGRVPLTTVGSLESMQILDGPLENGERIVLTDDEVEVEGVVDVLSSTGAFVRVVTVDEATWKDV